MADPSSLKLSIIIPAHNEAAYLNRSVHSARAAAEALDDPFEIIVVNDGSTDETAAVARRLGADVVDVAHRQIAATRNAGARAAIGDWLVFLDADTAVLPATLAAARQAIARRFAGGGAAVRFDRPRLLSSRLGVQCWNLTARLRRWAAGSFLFARADAFHAVDGFDERYFAAEELMLSDALKRHGPFALVGPPVVTSARKEQAFSFTDHFAVLCRVLASRGRALQSRDGLDIWYAPQRP